MEEEAYKPDDHLAFNMDVARLEAINSLMNKYSEKLIFVDIYGMYKSLEGIYEVTNYKFAPAERSKLNESFKKISPYKRISYGQLKEYAQELFILLHKYGFMGKKNNYGGYAITRR